MEEPEAAVGPVPTADLLGVDSLLNTIEVAGSSLESLRAEIAQLKESTILVAPQKITAHQLLGPAALLDSVEHPPAVTPTTDKVHPLPVGDLIALHTGPLVTGHFGERQAPPKAEDGTSLEDEWSRANSGALIKAVFPGDISAGAAGDGKRASDGDGESRVPSPLARAPDTATASPVTWAAVVKGMVRTRGSGGGPSEGETDGQQPAEESSPVVGSPNPFAAVLWSGADGPPATPPPQQQGRQSSAGGSGSGGTASGPRTAPMVSPFAPVAAVPVAGDEEGGDQEEGEQGEVRVPASAADLPVQEVLAELSELLSRGHPFPRPGAPRSGAPRGGSTHTSAGGAPPSGEAAPQRRRSNYETREEILSHLRAVNAALGRRKSSAAAGPRRGSDPAAPASAAGDNDAAAAGEATAGEAAGAEAGASARTDRRGSVLMGRRSSAEVYGQLLQQQAAVWNGQQPPPRPSTGTRSTARAGGGDGTPSAGSKGAAFASINLSTLLLKSPGAAAPEGTSAAGQISAPPSPIAKRSVSSRRPTASGAGPAGRRPGVGRSIGGTSYAARAASVAGKAGSTAPQVEVRSLTATGEPNPADGTQSCPVTPAGDAVAAAAAVARPAGDDDAFTTRLNLGALLTGNKQGSASSGAGNVSCPASPIAKRGAAGRGATSPGPRPKQQQHLPGAATAAAAARRLQAKQAAAAAAREYAAERRAASQPPPAVRGSPARRGSPGPSAPASTGTSRRSLIAGEGTGGGATRRAVSAEPSRRNLFGSGSTTAAAAPGSTSGRSASSGRSGAAGSASSKKVWRPGGAGQDKDESRKINDFLVALEEHKRMSAIGAGLSSSSVLGSTIGSVASARRARTASPGPTSPTARQPSPGAGATSPGARSGTASPRRVTRATPLLSAAALKQQQQELIQKHMETLLLKQSEMRKRLQEKQHLQEQKRRQRHDGPQRQPSWMAKAAAVSPPPGKPSPASPGRGGSSARGETAGGGNEALLHSSSAKAAAAAAAAAAAIKALAGGDFGEEDSHTAAAEAAAAAAAAEATMAAVKAAAALEAVAAVKAAADAQRPSPVNTTVAQMVAAFEAAAGGEDPVELPMCPAGTDELQTAMDANLAALHEREAALEAELCGLDARSSAAGSRLASKAATPKGTLGGAGPVSPTASRRMSRPSALGSKLNSTGGGGALGLNLSALSSLGSTTAAAAAALAAVSGGGAKRSGAGGMDAMMALLRQQLMEAVARSTAAQGKAAKGGRKGAASAAESRQSVFDRLYKEDPWAPRSRTHKLPSGAGANPVDEAIAAAEEALLAQRARALTKSLSSTRSRGGTSGSGAGAQQLVRTASMDRVAGLLAATRAELDKLMASGMSGRTLNPMQLRLISKLQAEERRLAAEQQQQLEDAAAAAVAASAAGSSCSPSPPRLSARRSGAAASAGGDGSAAGGSTVSPFYAAAARLGLSPFAGAKPPAVPEDRELPDLSREATARSVGVDGGDLDESARESARAAAAWLAANPLPRRASSGGITGQQLLAAYRAVSASEAEITAELEAEGAVPPGSTGGGLPLDDMLRAYNALTSRGRSSPDRAAALAALMASARSSAGGASIAAAGRTATIDSADLLFANGGELLNVPLHLLGGRQGPAAGAAIASSTASTGAVPTGADELPREASDDEVAALSARAKTPAGAALNESKSEAAVATAASPAPGPSTRPGSARITSERASPGPGGIISMQSMLAAAAAAFHGVVSGTATPRSGTPASPRGRRGTASALDTGAAVAASPPPQHEPQLQQQQQPVQASQPGSRAYTPSPAVGPAAAAVAAAAAAGAAALAAATAHEASRPQTPIAEVARPDGGLRLTATATGRAVLRFAAPPGSTVASARRTLCVGALVDATKAHTIAASPASSPTARRPGSRAKTPASRPGSSWLCFGSPAVREASPDSPPEAAITIAAAATPVLAADGSASPEGAVGGATALRFLVAPDGGLHVASPAPAARVERVVLSAGVWVPVGAQLEVVTASGERHAVMVPSEVEWARLVAGLNAAMLLADGAEWLRTAPVRDMVWSPRVEGILS